MTFPRASNSTPRSVSSGPLSGPRKPSASSTSSHSSSNSLPGISTIFGGPPFCFCHSSRTPCSFFTFPSASPEKDFVLMLQSRTTPSSWDDDVRRIIGQYGHGAVAVRRPEAVGARIAAAQDHDALPGREDLAVHAVARDDLVLLRQELHRVVDPAQLATRHLEVASPGRAAG